MIVESRVPRRAAVLLVLVTAGWIGAPASAGLAAAEPTPSPTASVSAAPAPSGAAQAAKLTVIGPETYAVELEAATDNARTGTLRLVMSNPAATAVDVSLQAYVEVGSGGPTCPDDGTLMVDPARVRVPAGVSEQPLRLRATKGCAGSDGTLVALPAGGEPVKVAFTFHDEDLIDPMWIFMWTTVVAVVIVAVMVLVVFLVAPAGWVTKPVPAGPAWSFKDSWLTNVSALGAVLGLVAAATGVLDEVVPGVSVPRVLAMNLLFGAMVAAAPVVYAAFGTFVWQEKKNDKDDLVATPTPTGTGGGLVLAATATVWGVIGQLTVLFALNRIAFEEGYAENGSAWIVGALLVIAAVVVAIYAVRFTRGVTSESGKPADTPIAETTGIGSGTL